MNTAHNSVTACGFLSDYGDMAPSSGSTPRYEGLVMVAFLLSEAAALTVLLCLYACVTCVFVTNWDGICVILEFNICKM